MDGRSSPRSSLRHTGRNHALAGRTWAKEHLLLGGGLVLPLIGRIATSDSRQLSASAVGSLDRIVSRKVPLPDSLEGQLPRAREHRGSAPGRILPSKVSAAPGSPALERHMRGLRLVRWTAAGWQVA